MKLFELIDVVLVSYLAGSADTEILGTATGTAQHLVLCNIDQTISVAVHITDPFCHLSVNHLLIIPHRSKGFACKIYFFGFKLETHTDLSFSAQIPLRSDSKLLAPPVFLT